VHKAAIVGHLLIAQCLFISVSVLCIRVYYKFMQSHHSYFWFRFHYNVDMPWKLTKSVSNTTAFYVLIRYWLWFLTCVPVDALMQGFTSPSGYLLKVAWYEGVKKVLLHLWQSILFSTWFDLKFVYVSLYASTVFVSTLI
jgi:hypothetical protein